MSCSNPLYLRIQSFRQRWRFLLVCLLAFFVVISIPLSMSNWSSLQQASPSQIPTLVIPTDEPTSSPAVPFRTKQPVETAISTPPPLPTPTLTPQMIIPENAVTPIPDIALLPRCLEAEGQLVRSILKDEGFLPPYSFVFNSGNGGQPSFYSLPAVITGQTRSDFVPEIGTLDLVRVVYLLPDGRLADTWLVYWVSRNDRVFSPYLQLAGGGEPADAEEARSLVSFPRAVYLTSPRGPYISERGIDWTSCIAADGQTDGECDIARQLDADGTTRSFLAGEHLSPERYLYGWRIKLSGDPRADLAQLCECQGVDCERSSLDSKKRPGK